MGKTIEKVALQNYGDMVKAEEGLIPENDIRTVEIEGIVDTGATYLCLPPKVIEQLGLRYSHSRKVRTANGDVERRMFHGAYITIKDRYEQMSVMENNHDTPTLIGVLILEALDFVVDTRARALIPNPASEGQWMADLY